jgi:hypothetical protein
MERKRWRGSDGEEERVQAIRRANRVGESAYTGERKAVKAREKEGLIKTERKQGCRERR